MTVAVLFVTRVGLVMQGNRFESRLNSKKFCVSQCSLHLTKSRL